MLLSQIHEDERGKIYLLKHAGKEFLLLETKKDHSRGGDYHKSRQHDIVLSGRVVFLCIEHDVDVMVEAEEGYKTTFQPQQPHMFTALTDCLVLEWLEGPFEKIYYGPFRKLVK